MSASFLGDLVVALHVGYVGFVVLGEMIIILGVVVHWAWVRNPWFRAAHLGAILIVAAETVFGVTCPLTVLEDHYRRLGGEHPSPIDFVGRCLHHLLFLDLPPWAFPILHLGFAAAVIGTVVLVPPRGWFRPRSPRAGGFHDGRSAAGG